MNHRGILRTAFFLFILLICLSLKRSEAAEDICEIFVEGGHAEDENGNVITKAQRGESVILVPNLQAGKYVSGWMIDGVERSGVEGMLITENKTIVKAIWKEQTPYTIDLTGLADITDNSAFDYLCDAVGVDKYDVVYNGKQEIDLDGDGTKDCKYVTKRLTPSGREYLIPLVGSSISGSITFDELTKLPYWPVTVNFGTNPIRETYSIRVYDGKASDENGNVITEAKPGELVTLSYEPNTETYLIKWDADGIDDFHGYYYLPDEHLYRNSVGMNERFIMPAMDLTIHPVTGTKQPYTLDLRDGYEIVDSDIVDCIGKSLNGYVELGQEVDLDNNGVTDLLNIEDYIYTGHHTIIPTAGCSFTDSVELEGINAGRYWPITILFEEVKKEYTITVNGGHAEDDYGNTIVTAGPGEHVLVKADYTDGHYWKEWKSDFPEIIKNQIIFSFCMPACDIEITSETVAVQTPYTIDMTEVTVRDEDVGILVNMALANAFEVGKMEYDLDENGTNDVTFYNAGRYAYLGAWAVNINNTFARRDAEYSLWESTTVNVKNGPYGPITFVVDVDKANARPEEEYHITNPEELKSYSITVTHGSVENERGEIVTSARKGTKLYLYPDSKDGYILSFWDWNAYDVELYQEEYNSPYYFIMPVHYMSFMAVYKEKTTPTPTVKPTSTPTPTVEPTAEPTEPSDVPADSSEKKEDSSLHPIYFIIPSCVLMFAVVTAVLLMRRKKRAATSETEEAKPEEEPKE